MKRSDPTIGNIGDLRLARPLKGEPAFESTRREAPPAPTEVRPAPRPVGGASLTNRPAGRAGIRGRLARMRFVVRLGASLSVPVTVLGLYLDPVHDFLEKRPDLGFGLLAVTLGLAVLYQAAVAGARARDLGRPGWLGLAMLVPGLNVLAALVLAVVPGNEGPNHHGPPNPRNGVLVWLGYLVFVLLPLGLAPSGVLYYDIYLQTRHAETQVKG